MGNRRLGRKRLESALKSMNSGKADSTGSRSGLKGIAIPSFETQPSKYFGMFDDFHAVTSNQGVAVNNDAAQATSVDSDMWNAAIGGSSDAIATDSTKTGGVLKFTLGSSAGEETAITAPQIGFKIDSSANTSRKIWFEARLQLDDISGAGFFVGLASNNGAIEATAIDSLEDGIGFICATGATPNIMAIAAEGNSETQTDTTEDIADQTWVVLSFYFDGDSAHWYVNGDLKVSNKLTLPDDGTILLPHVEFTSVGTDQDVTYLDYVRCVMER